MAQANHTHFKKEKEVVLYFAAFLSNTHVGWLLKLSDNRSALLYRLFFFLQYGSYSSYLHCWNLKFIDQGD